MSAAKGPKKGVIIREVMSSAVAGQNAGTFRVPLREGEDMSSLNARLLQIRNQQSQSKPPSTKK